MSPTDAVAVNAIMEKLRVPARLSTVLSGESLMNDATGLVAFTFALAAVIAGGFSVGQFAWQFSLVSLGGFAIGLAVGWGIGQVRDLLRRFEAGSPTIEITLSLMTPFAAYLPAAHWGTSGILAVVAAGLYSGWRDPVRMDVETRQSAFAVWGLLIFWLNGNRVRAARPAIPRDSGGRPRLLFARRARRLHGCGGGRGDGRAPVLGFCRALRAGNSAGLCRRDARAATGLVLGWAGMRGTVTLAGALSIPYLMPDGTRFPGRDIVVFLAFGVIAVTLLLQGTTLERLIHRVKLREDNTREKEELLARTTAVAAGLTVLRVLEAEAKTPDHNAALRQVIGEYENRLAVLEAEGETRASARRRRKAGHRYRSLALKAERTAVDGLWRENKIADEVHRPLQQLLDHEEALLLAGPPPSEDEGALK
ncbi:MAG: cation:proton antiporter [Lacunisphaera sp.]